MGFLQLWKKGSSAGQPPPRCISSPRTTCQSAGFPTFVEYANAYTTGDIVGVIVDMDAGTISFSINGVDQVRTASPLLTDLVCQRHVTWVCMLQGVAFKEDVRGRVLVPAVCGGGAHNGQAHRISIVEPPFAFDTDQCAEYAASSGGRLRCLACCVLTPRGWLPGTSRLATTRCACEQAGSGARPACRTAA